MCTTAVCANLLPALTLAAASIDHRTTPSMPLTKADDLPGKDRGVVRCTFSEGACGVLHWAVSAEAGYHMTPSSKPFACTAMAQQYSVFSLGGASRIREVTLLRSSCSGLLPSVSATLLACLHVRDSMACGQGQRLALSQAVH